MSSYLSYKQPPFFPVFYSFHFPVLVHKAFSLFLFLKLNYSSILFNSISFSIFRSKLQFVVFSYQISLPLFKLAIGFWTFTIIFQISFLFLFLIYFIFFNQCLIFIFIFYCCFQIIRIPISFFPLEFSHFVPLFRFSIHHNRPLIFLLVV